MKKRINLSVTALLVCASIFGLDASETEKPMMPPAVTLQEPSYLIVSSFSGLAMQPFANNLDFAAEALPFTYGQSQPAVSPNWVIPVISPDYHFGFDVSVAGIFHGAKSSLAMNWERFHTSNDSQSLNVADINNMIGPFFEIGPDASVYKKAKGRVNFHFDEVNLDYGTFVRFGELLNVNFFAGATFSRIYQHRFTQFSDFVNSTVRTIKVPSKFIGIGPQVGFDFIYKIVKGFKFVGTTRASLFVGRFRNTTTYSTKSNDLVRFNDVNPNIQHTNVYHKGGVVPGFEGKLGLAYEYFFGSKCDRMVKVEAGYQAQIYLSAIRSIDMGSEVALNAIGSIGSGSTGVYARTFQRTVSDFAMAGPYGKIDLAF